MWGWSLAELLGRRNDPHVSPNGRPRTYSSMGSVHAARGPSGHATPWGEESAVSPETGIGGALRQFGERERGPPSLSGYLAAPDQFPEVGRAAERAAAPLPPVGSIPPRPMVRRPGSPIEPPLQRPPTSFPFPLGTEPPISPAPVDPRSLAASGRMERERERVLAAARGSAALSNASRYVPHYSRSAPEASSFPFPVRYGSNGSMATERAAAETGISQPYLDALIEHESGGDDTAKASTSSATGPAQFIDATWLRVMRSYGPAYGLPDNISDKDLLRLRTNRSWAALMAAEYAHENRQVMQRALRRPITEGEAYLGHFLGGDDAADLVAAHEANLPDARRFVSTSAVLANPRIFYEGGHYVRRTRADGTTYMAYHGGGRPRSAREVYQLQTRRFRNERLSDRRGDDG